MAFREWGNPPIFSSVATTGTDPSTATVCAEIQGLENKNYEVRFLVGASTSAIWRLEHCLSTGLGSTGIRHGSRVFTGSNQSAEYVLTFRAEQGDLLRVVPASSFSGTWACDIQAEILT